MILSSILLTIDPLLLRWVIDQGIPSRDIGLLSKGVAAIGLCYIARTALQACGQLLSAMASRRLSLSLRGRLIDRLQSLTFNQLTKWSTGEMTNRLQQDVEEVIATCGDLLPVLIKMIVTTIVVVIAMTYLDWQLTLLLATGIPAYLAIRRYSDHHLKAAAENVRRLSGTQSSVLFETVASILQIQSLGIEQFMSQRYVSTVAATQDAVVTRRKHELRFGISALALLGVGTIVVLGLGGSRVMDGSMTLGTLVAFLGFWQRFFDPFGSSVELFARLTRMRASIVRIAELDGLASARNDHSDAELPPGTPSIVRAEHLCFSRNSGQSVIHSVGLTLRRGETVALVGESGSGKTTLARLLASLDEVTSGSVFFDEHDAKQTSVKSLRSRVSMVPQDPVVFSGTLLENLRCVCPDAETHRVEQAAHTACFDTVVERSKHGWNTSIGPGGVELSGGEKQRLALARAILQERPVLILDEVTSTIDPQLQQLLLRRVGLYGADRIVLLITHRTAVAQYADRVAVMNGGTIVETGSHTSLLVPGTEYFRLFSTQPQTVAS